jgi:membrane protein implicated in regulation of membrane protease activity
VAVLLATLIAAAIAGTVLHLIGIRTLDIGGIEITLDNGWRPFAAAAVLSVIALVLNWRRARARTVIFAVMAVLLGLAIALTSQPLPQQWLSGDAALFEIYTRNAASGQQLLGAYSQFGWNHPGPLPFYTFLPFYQLGGHGQHALNGAALATNLLALSVIAWMTLRHGSGLVAPAVALFVLVYLARIPELPSSFWNPHILMLPLVAWLALCAAIAIGETALIPAAVLIGSWIIQAHVGLSIAVIACVMMTAVLAFGTGRSLPRSTVWLTAIVLIVVWALPVAEQLTSTPGNMREIVEFFLFQGGARPSIGVSVRAVGAMLAGVFRPAFEVARGWSFEPAEWRWAIGGFALAAALLLLVRAEWRRGARYNAALGAGCLALVAAGYLSAANIRGTIGDYQLFWLSIVGVVSMALIVSASVQPRLPNLPKVPLTVLTLLLYAAACAVTFRAFTERANAPPSTESLAVETLTGAVTTALRNGVADRLLLEVDPKAWDIAAGIVLHLSKAEIDVNVDPTLVWLYGAPYRADGLENTVLTVAAADQHRKAMQQPGRSLLGEHNQVFVSIRRIEPFDSNLTVR